MNEENKLLTAAEAKTLSAAVCEAVDKKVCRMLDKIRLHAIAGDRFIQTVYDSVDYNLWNEGSNEDNNEFREAKEMLETLGYRVSAESFVDPCGNVRHYTKIYW